MSYFDSDAQDMLEVYLMETAQLLGQMSAVLLEAERKNSFLEEEIHTVFRVMHTIKSSSAMMGLLGLSSMAHKLEDLFSWFREQHRQIDDVEPELFDLLFAASDLVESELERMEEEDYIPADTKELEAKAQEYLQELCRTAGGDGRTEGKNAGAGTESIIGEKQVSGERQISGISDDTAGTQTESGNKEEKTADSGQEEELPELFAGKIGTIVRVRLEKGCRMENIRAFMLVRQIGPLCSRVETCPEGLEKNGQASEFIAEHGVFLCIESENPDQVLETLKKGLFVRDCEVIEIRVPKQEEESVSEKTAPVSREARDAEFLSVRTERLDILQNLAGEMLIQMLVLDDELERNGLKEVKEGTSHQISRLISEVERTVMQMRLVPIERIVPKLRRILRDMCRDQKKEAELIVNCGDIEADKNVTDCASEALLHLLRNAVDHGIELPSEREAAGKSRKGKITFTAENMTGEILISLSDDGKGIETDKIRDRAKEKGLLTRPEEEYDKSEILDFILRPGFSTNEEVTEYSGRGVGLDVVKNIVEESGGHLYIDTESGRGTTFTMSVPMTLSTIECIRFRVGEYRFSLPARHVFQFLDYWENVKNVRKINGRDYILYDDRMVPMIDLRKFYRLGGEIPLNALLVYIKGTEREGCILIDSMYEQKRIVIKPFPALFGPGFRRMTGMNGCSIMGNGSICASLDTEILIRKYEREGGFGYGSGR